MKEEENMNQPPAPTEEHLRGAGKKLPMTAIIIAVILAVLVGVEVYLFSGNERKENDVVNVDALPSNTIPMYGFLSYDDYLSHRSAQQAKTDDDFVTLTLKKGSAPEASNYAVKKGFEYLGGGDPDTAIKRFNQGWLLAHENQNVYWGYAVYTANKKGNEAALQYFDMALEKFDRKYVQSATDQDQLMCDAAIGYASAYEDGGKTKSAYLNKAHELASDADPRNASQNCKAIMSNVVPSAALSVHTLKVGDTVGGFIVSSIDLYPSVYGDGSQDFTIKYSGTATVSGEYYWSEMLGKVCFTPSAADAQKIPRMKEDTRNPGFCFSNTEHAQNVLVPIVVEGASGVVATQPAMVTIKNYSEIVARKEGSDLTELVAVKYRIGQYIDTIGTVQEYIEGDCGGGEPGALCQSELIITLPGEDRASSIRNVRINADSCVDETLLQNIESKSAHVIGTIKNIVPDIGLVLSCNSQDTLIEAVENASYEPEKILSVVAEGGLCPGSVTCRSVLDIYSDGAFAYDGDRYEHVLDVRRLETLIENADFEGIKQKPFVGTCPSAYDGSQVIYHFYLGSDEEVVDACRVAVDLTDPLFVEIENLKREALHSVQ